MLIRSQYLRTYIMYQNIYHNKASEKKMKEQMQDKIQLDFPSTGVEPKLLSLQNSSIYQRKHRNKSKMKFQTRPISPQKKQRSKITRKPVFEFLSMNSLIDSKRVHNAYFLKQENNDLGVSKSQQITLGFSQRCELYEDEESSGFKSQSFSGKSHFDIFENYCEIKLEQYREKIGIQKYERIVQGILSREVSKDKNANLFLNNRQNFYRRYKKFHNKLANQIPQCFQTKAATLKKKQACSKPQNRRSKLKMGSFNSCNHSERPHLKNNVLKDFASKNTKLKRLFQKRERNKTQPVNISPECRNLNQGKKKKQKLAGPKFNIFGDIQLSPWQIQLRVTQIGLPTITKYQAK